MQVAYLSIHEVPVLWTIDSLIFQEDTVALAGAHEVVVTCARREATANCGPWLLTLLATLNPKQNNLQMSVQQTKPGKMWLTKCLTSCFPLRTAMWTFFREPSSSSNTSADHRAQFTWVHSFCPMYNSLPPSWNKQACYRWHKDILICFRAIISMSDSHWCSHLHTFDTEHTACCH